MMVKVEGYFPVNMQSRDKFVSKQNSSFTTPSCGPTQRRKWCDQILRQDKNFDDLLSSYFVRIETFLLVDTKIMVSIHKLCHSFSTHVSFFSHLLYILLQRIP